MTMATMQLGERTATATPGIKLHEVRKTFGDVVAVAGIDLTVGRGEFLTLLGPSGCGKTTTLRMIGGFELPSSGEVLIDGAQMGNLPPYRRPVNTVFQNYALFPHLSVGKNVAYGLEMSGVPKGDRDRRVREALDLVRLSHVENRRPSELSGGQQQRVALARALVNRPAVLLLDEPLGALDLKLRKAMQLELKHLNREVGATFVYVTHDQEEALTMSDRIAVMNEGRILQLGAPEDIYERPRSRFVADFIGQTNFIECDAFGNEGGFFACRTAGGETIRARAAEGAPVSGKVTLAVRPEKVSLDAEAPAGTSSGWNRLTGTLAEVIYLGTHTQLVIALPGDGQVVVHRQNRLLGEAEPATGQPVTVVFDPAATTVLAD
jgi:spermidine/putrescine transport system ATP-binding protein